VTSAILLAWRGWQNFNCTKRSGSFSARTEAEDHNLKLAMETAKGVE
jgi:hypothetical protein